MSRVIRTPYENCDLHQALMNTGYAVYRKNYYHNGKHTGKVVDYYAPAIDYTSQRYKSATLSQLYERDRRLGTDFVGDLERICFCFGLYNFP